MRIGIIGAGNIGGALTRRFRQLGYDVSVANSRGPQTLSDLARETGAKAVTAHEAARDQDVVVVTIPESKIPDLPADLFAGVPSDVVVIDTGNYYPRQRDGRLPGSKKRLARAAGSHSTLGARSLRRSTIFMRSICATGGNLRGLRVALHFRSRVTMQRRKPSSCSSSTRSASTHR